MRTHIPIIVVLLLLITTLAGADQPGVGVQPLVLDQTAVPVTDLKTPYEAPSLESAMITWFPVDSMSNAYSVLSNAVDGIAYDPASGLVAVIHRGLAPGYAQSSGELWFNISTNAGTSWQRVGSLNDGFGFQARYPSIAIRNVNNSSNLANVEVAYSAPYLAPGPAFGWVQYGVSPADPLLASAFGIVEELDTTLFSNSEIWTMPGAGVGSKTVFWGIHQDGGGAIDQYRFWGTDDYTSITSTLPPSWSASHPQGTVRGWLYSARTRGNVQYGGGLNIFNTDPGDILNIGYTTSTNRGNTWGLWKYPGSADSTDWRSVPGLAGTIWDDLYDYSPTADYINTRNMDMEVDADGRVHFFAFLVDDPTSAMALAEIYETSTGWAGRIIQGDVHENTNWNYGTTAQMGPCIRSAISPDGQTLAVYWLDAPSTTNALPDIWVSYRKVTGNWSTPENLTQTPTVAELAMHVAPVLKDNGGNSYTAYLIRSYQSGTTAHPPNESAQTTIYAGTHTFSAGQLQKDIEVVDVTLAPPAPIVGTPVTVSAFIQNLGVEANPASVTLTYKLGSAPASAGDGTQESFTPVWSGRGATVTFTSPLVPSAGGQAMVYVRSFYPGDGDSTNDTGSESITIVTQNDIAATLFVSPPNTGGVRNSVPFSPVAGFRNAGILGQASPFPVSYRILGPGGATVYSDSQTVASLDTGVVVPVTFATVSGGLTVGTYTMVAVAALAGDQDHGNDTLRGMLTVLPVISTFPYSETFEDAAAVTGGAGWFAGMHNPRPVDGTAPDPVIDWVRGTPAKTQLSGAHGGTKCYVTKESGNYTENTETFLHSPVFDLSSMTGGVLLRFWQNFRFEPEWDGGVLEMSADGGLTWGRVDNVAGTGPNYTTAHSFNWYGPDSLGLGYLDPPSWNDTSTGYAGHTGGWIQTSTTIDGIAGLGDVRFRWVFSSDEATADEGWAIDDVSLEQATSVEPVPGAPPSAFALLQNYPNPFNPSTTIRFALPEASVVTVEVYNLIGQKVRTLLQERMPAGYHSVEWNGSRGQGPSAGSGVYFVRFAAEGASGKSFTDVRKIMLLK